MNTANFFLPLALFVNFVVHLFEFHFQLISLLCLKCFLGDKVKGKNLTVLTSQLIATVFLIRSYSHLNLFSLPAAVVEKALSRVNSVKL